MKNLLAAILLVVSFNACADDWSDADTARELTFVAFSAVDWRQTMDIANHPRTCTGIRCDDGLQEVNPILGAHPSNSRINTYFSLGILAHYSIAKLLPKDIRPIWQVSGIVFEAYYVNNNIHMGLSAKF